MCPRNWERIQLKVPPEIGIKKLVPRNYSDRRIPDLREDCLRHLLPHAVVCVQ